MFGSLTATIYYGMCGAFKSSMISHKHKDSQKVYSEIKQFVDIADKLEAPYNDLTLAAIRLNRLKSLPINNNIAIERGITDYLHCFLMRSKDIYLSEEEIQNASIEENSILLKKGINKVSKVLLIMKDKEFIKNEILSEPHRLKTYPTLDYYLNCQDYYVKFTKEYNNIDEVIEITDAVDFLNKLSEKINN